ncbi:MAG: stage II sporulation protein M [Acidobacteria bacterium]|nr:stage II sporulation protein M [Acidobacteriota bacterium]
MILDLPRFVKAESAYWTELEGILDKLDEHPATRLPLPDVERLHYLYERCSAGLARLRTFSAETATIGRLEALVARAYGEIHETRTFDFRAWPGMAWRAFPKAFRRRIQAFQFALLVTLAGCALGWFAIQFDAGSKAVLMPFPGLMETPAERVAREEKAGSDRLRGKQATFSAELMTNNIRVTFVTLALGMTWGVGTLVVLFHNGVILGAVAADYVLAGKGVFLLGWLLPHGVVEIPAILVGAQGGFVLAGAVSAEFSRAVSLLALCAVWIGYSLVLEWWWRGRTVGKRILGLRVMDVNGLRLDPSQIVLRNLLRFIDAMPLFYLVGGVTALCSGKSQRLGDFAANTVVIRHRREEQPDFTGLFGTRYNSLLEHPVFAARLRTRVGAEAAAIALRALVEREHYEPRARVELFGEIAAYFRSLQAFPGQAVDEVSDEQLVRNIMDVVCWRA